MTQNGLRKQPIITIKLKKECGSVSIETKRLHELKIKSSNNSAETIYTLNDATDDATNAFAYGTNAVADKVNSAAFGNNTRTNNENQFVIGRFNTYQDKDNRLFIIGNGTNNDKTSDAFSVDSDGNIIATGSATFSNGETQDLQVTNTATVGQLIINNKTLQLKNIIAPMDGVVNITKTIDGTTIDDPIVTLSTLNNQAQPQLTISKKNGQIILKGHNLNQGKNYTIRTLMRSRHNGSRTGEWRELTDKAGYGYYLLEGTKRSDTSKFPMIPSNDTWQAWMGNGKLQHTWNEGLIYNKNYQCHQMIIDGSTWLLPALKPLIVYPEQQGSNPASTIIATLPRDLQAYIEAIGGKKLTEATTQEDEQNNAEIIANYLFDSSSSKPPKIAMLTGLQSSGGYRGLQFKFRLYDGNILLAETNEILHISGSVHHKNGRRIPGENGNTIEQPTIFKYCNASSIVEINTKDEKSEISNLFISVI